MSTLDICAIDTGMRTRKPMQDCGWIRSGWVPMSLTSVVTMAAITGIITFAPVTYVLGQIVLGLSVYVSLSFLADRPLINPIQAFVAVFYWWIGVGPAVIATWNCLLGATDAALKAETSSTEALWVLAPGLILYALVARQTLNWFSKTGAYARFLLPSGLNYRPRTLVVYLSLIGFSVVMLAILPWMGIQGREEVSYLGGTKTTIWWVGAIAAIGTIAPFISSALMTAFAAPWKTIPPAVWILIGIVTTQTVLSALFGGWKSPIAILGAYYTCAYVSRNQRPPWLVLVFGAVVFLVIIAPFVAYGRNIARTSGAETSAMRKQVFFVILDKPEAFLPAAMEGIDISVFFRGIAPLAGELTRRNELFEGEWHGETILRGFEAIVPRAFNPGKQDVTIGNFFSRTIGADIGMTSRTDTSNAIGVSLPFEILGNYGIIAGFLSFGLIGFLWTLFVVWMLSPARLSNHPLTPYLALSTIGFEQALGHYLSGLRDLVIPLFLCFFVYKLLNGKL